MKKAILLIFILLICVGFYFYNKNPYDFSGISDDNKSVTLSNFNGEYKIIYFGYLFCPDVCPNALLTLSNVLNKIKNDNIKLIFITLDPERDTPQNLGEFARNFNQNAVGIRLYNLEKVAKNYGVKFKKIEMPDSAMIYSVAHSSSFYLVDKDGKFYSEISNLTEENIEEKILQMLNNRQ